MLRSSPPITVDIVGRFLPAERAPKRLDSDDLVLMVAGLARSEPGITLDGIARRLQAMGQRTPRGGLRWCRSSVKNLLDRAREEGLVREAQQA
jgi:hypothetical protein